MKTERKSRGGNDDQAAVVDDGYLLCLECGGQYLHHGETRVINRVSEDQSGTIATIVVDGMSLKTIEAKDIPGRRDCVEIDFRCENCSESAFTLRIKQHKGKTLVDWVDNKDASAVARSRSSSQETTASSDTPVSGDTQTDLAKLDHLRAIEAEAAKYKEAERTWCEAAELRMRDSAAEERRDAAKRKLYELLGIR